MKKIALIGERISDFKPHDSIYTVVRHVCDNLKANVELEWVDTGELEKKGQILLKSFSGIWSVPGSPFKSLDGAVKAIEYARENNIPHLGTCAGFQHAVIEFARNVLNIKEAQHEEYDVNSSKLFISSSLFVGR